MHILWCTPFGARQKPGSQPSIPSCQCRSVTREAYIRLIEALRGRRSTCGAGERSATSQGVVTTFSYCGSEGPHKPADLTWLKPSSVTTFVYGDGGIAKIINDRQGWLISSPDAEFGWEMPHSTHVGGLGRPGDLVVIGVFLAVHDGIIDHAQNHATVDWELYDELGGREIHRAIGKLCSDILGAQVSDVAKTVGDLPARRSILAAFRPTTLLGSRWERPCQGDD